MYIYDINTYLKNDTTLLTLSEKTTIDIEPAAGYEDSEPPVILWWYFPGLVTTDIPGWRKDRLRYQVLDNDAVRCIAVGERMVALLNKAEHIRTAVASSDFTGKYSFLASGELQGPVLREGWFRFKIDFVVSYVPNS